MSRLSKLFVLLVTVVMVLSVAPVLAQNTIQIDMWQIFADQRLQWLEDRAAQFEAEYPQYNIEIRAFDGYEALIDQYTLTVDANGNPTASSPEIAMIFEIGTQFARDSGWFRPVAEAIGDRAEINGQPVDFSDIIAPITGYYTVEGVWSSMPWASSTPIMYANMNLLVEAGIASSLDDTSAIPTTWAELEAACETILAAGLNNVTGCISWPNHGWFFEQWLAQQNTDLVNNGNGREGRATEVLLTSPAAINIATWWQSMYSKGYYAYTGVQRDWSGTEQALQAGQLPFILTSSAGARGITDTAASNGITIRTGRMPYDGEVGWTGNIIGGGTLWLTRDLAPEVEEGALTWLLFMTNTENAACWHTASGYLVLRQSAIDLLENPTPEANIIWNGETCVPAESSWFEANPNFRTAGEQIGQSTVTTATRGALFGTFIPTRNLITQAMEDLMLAGGDPAERLAQAQADARTLLEEYNLLYVTE